MAFDADKFETTNWDASRIRKAQEEKQQQLRQQRKRTRRRNSAVSYIAFVLAVSAILAGVGWLFVNDVCSFNKKYVETTITVKEDESVGAVAKELKSDGLINYRGLFGIYAALTHASAKIGAGVYTLNSDMDYRALVNAMTPRKHAADAGTVTVTIPEGYTVKQVIALLAEKGVNTEEALTEAAKNSTFEYTFIDNENLGEITRLEGYLFPDTYEFYEGEDPTSALKRLVDNFYSKISTYLDTIEASAYSVHDIVTIASIVEKEAASDSERPDVASVIYNRLKGGMTLGMESTLKYAAELNGLDTVDTNIESGYNTYKNPGLPTGPISNPGLASLEAAVEPAETKYYYFALGTDKTTHFFADYNSFLAFTKSGQYAG